MNSNHQGHLRSLSQSARGVTPAIAARTLAGLLALLWATTAQAAEIQLRPDCRARGPVVTLGDVAQVASADAQEAARLNAIELFPSPPSGRQRFVRVREIQDLLMVRGIGLSQHRFSGSSVVAIQAASEAVRPTEQRSLSPTAVKSAERVASDAIVRYLREQEGKTETWIVETQLGSAAARAIGVGANRIFVRGGAAPWLGTQRFEITVETSDQPQSFLVEARVSKPAMVVVTARSVARGATLRPDDLALRHAATGEDAPNGFHAIGEVVGMETTRALGEGHMLDRETLRAPLAVRRGEMVTVYARSAGLRVRTTARTRDDGSIGDLVAVESLADRKTFTARVCGIQEVEVFARAVQAASPVAEMAGDSRGMLREPRGNAR